MYRDWTTIMFLHCLQSLIPLISLPSHVYIPTDNVNKPKTDPRKNKNLASNQKHTQPGTTNQQEEDNVYNPKKDLYSSRPPPLPQQQPYVPQIRQQQQHDTYNQEVYSPTQDVQDMYATKSRKHSNNPIEDNNSERGMYNPMQDLNSTQRNPTNQGPPPGITPLGPPWGGGNGGHQYHPYDTFYGGGPNQNVYGGNQGEDAGFYNSGPDTYGGMNSGGRGGFGGGMHGGGMMTGTANRGNDPRTNRRDPRRKD